jgi:muramoyltetrapeptide carboxypeptidase LdcA involved in peptidoglycan recycling
VAAAEIARYNPDAVVCIGVPFGHTRPQWIIPYGGQIQLNGEAKTITANYS